ncbi:MAG TPA: hypothetical protein VMF07_01340 [Solirubrobacteraceae bacterium]|nr:hypothetical protein [Solirubrobacteraceae bacterium]
MSTTAMHPLAADYLRRLREAGRGLPTGRLDDLCAEIESHLAEAIPPGTSDADALSVIERLGPPEEIVEAEQPAPADPGRDPRTWREWAAVVLLPLGGFVFGIGWIAGVVLLWSSRAWTTRQKVLGTLIVPGGVAAFFPVLVLSAVAAKSRCVTVARRNGSAFGVGSRHCVLVGGPSSLHVLLAIVLIACVVIGPILVAVHLARSAGRAPAV